MKYPLVMIEWEDSVQPSSSWQLLADYEPSDAVHIRSVGWLIADGDVKALAPNLGEVGGECEQASGVIHIPARCVIEITELAQGIEAATADETRSGSAEGESPVPNGDAPNTQPPERPVL